jgi:hypothetical protein
MQSVLAVIHKHPGALVAVPTTETARGTKMMNRKELFKVGAAFRDPVFDLSFTVTTEPGPQACLCLPAAYAARGLIAQRKPEGTIVALNAKAQGNTAFTVLYVSPCVCLAP